MASDDVSILYYSSESPRGRLLDFLKFAKEELRGIAADAREQKQIKTSDLAERCVDLQGEIWDEAVHKCNDPVETYASESGVKTMAEATESAMFDLTVRRDWGWLRSNWHDILPIAKKAS